MNTGATSPQLQTEAEMIKAIREAGRTPVHEIRFTSRSKFLPTPAKPMETRMKIPRARKCWKTIWRRRETNLKGCKPCKGVKNLPLQNLRLLRYSYRRQKPKDKNYRLNFLQKTFRVAIGYGLVRKPRIFNEENRPSTRPIGRGLAGFSSRRFAVPLTGAR
jgi:hypothetical protein